MGVIEEPVHPLRDGLTVVNVDASQSVNQYLEAELAEVRLDADVDALIPQTCNDAFNVMQKVIIHVNISHANKKRRGLKFPLLSR